MILWKGHCSVHGRFSADTIPDLRASIPGVQILVHPECTHEVVLEADLVGSTEFIIQTVEAAPAGSAWAVGTELNLVKRLAADHPDKRIVFLDKTVCYCSTMNRIDLPHFVWAMESLVDGPVVNQIQVTRTPSSGRRSPSTGCSRCPARRTGTEGSAGRRLDLLGTAPSPALGAIPAYRLKPT